MSSGSQVQLVNDFILLKIYLCGVTKYFMSEFYSVIIDLIIIIF